MQRIGICPGLAREDDRLGGEGAGIISVSHAVDGVRLGVANLGTQHEVDIVDAVEGLHEFSHRLPGPLAVAILRGLVHTSIRQEALLHAVGTLVFCEEFLLAHGVGVLVGIFAQGIGILLQAKLRGNLQIVGEAQLGIENCHHRTVAALGVGIGSLLEDIEVERGILLALHVGIVVVVTVLIVWSEVWVCQSGIIYRVGKAITISEIGVLLTLVGIYGSTHLEEFVHLVVGLQGDVVSGVAHTLHVTLLVGIAHGCIVIALVAATRDADVVLLGECIAEEDIIPVGIGVAELVNLVLGCLAQRIPSACLIGTGFAQAAEDACYPTLVLAIGVIRCQQTEFQVYLLIAVEQVEAVDIRLRHEGHLAREVDDRCSRTSLLGGDDDDTIGCSRTVDGSGCSILEHGDVVDIGWIQSGDGSLVDIVDILQIFHAWDIGAIHRDTIEHPQRFLGTVDGSGTTDADLHRRTRCTRRGDGRKSGNLSGKCLVDVVDGTDFLIADFQGGYRRSQLASVQFLITRHHHLANLLGVRFQNHLIVVFSCYNVDILGFESHESYGERLILGIHLEGELSFVVGHGAM